MNIATIIAAILAVLAVPAPSIAREVPSMPNECAATRCAAIVANANFLCAEETLDEEICDLVLRDLEKCIEACAGGD